MTKIYRATISHNNEHFNPKLKERTPSYYNIICDDADTPDFSPISINAETIERATRYLIGEMKLRGINGKLSVTHSYSL